MGCIRRLAALSALAAAVAVVALSGAALVAEPAVAAPPNEGGWDRQWGMRLIGAEAAWDAGLMGEGIDIAVIDTGVHLSHQDLSERIGPGKNYVDPGRPPQDDYEPRGHGTHVAGIAAAGYANGGVVGVAPKARIMPIKVLHRDGSGSSSDVAAAMRWAADNGAEVINLSLGEFDKSLFGPSTQEAIEYVWQKGAIAVFAAGNDFVLPSGFEDEPAIVVAAVNRDDQKSYFSSDVGNAMWAMAAPGGAAGVTDPVEERIFSTVWVDDSRTDTYDYMQGTSMAAPHVSGAAALLRGAGLSPRETVERLLATAEDLGREGPDSTYGHGRLDVARAVEGLGGGRGGQDAPSAAAPSPTAPPPTERQPPPTTAAPAPGRGPAGAPTTAEETTTTTTAVPGPTSSPDDDATDGTVAIQVEDGGGGSGRPWVPIGLATAALGTAAAGVVLSRRLLASRA